MAESTFKMIKAEFVSCRRFDTLDQLQLELADYVHWLLKNYVYKLKANVLAVSEIKQATFTPINAPPNDIAHYIEPI